MKAIFIFFLFLCTNLSGQEILFSESFENGDLSGWTASQGTNAFVFDADGKAENAIGWGNRPAIISPSDDSEDTHGTAALEIDPVDADDMNMLTLNPANLINCSNATKVFIRFNQYFGLVDMANASVGVRVEGMDWMDFPITANNDLLPGRESTPWDVQEIDISSAAAGNFVQIRFSVQGETRFWIIDDIIVFTDRPVVVPTPYFGDSLEVFGKPYDVGADGWPFVPYQVVVEFEETATELEKQAIRDTFGFALIDTCVCNKLELWALDGQGDLSMDFPINERVMGVRSKSKVNGADKNKFNFNELKDTIIAPTTPLPAVPAGITNTPNDAIVIAVLDTGIDFAPDAPLTPMIWQNMGQDTCYDDDFIGWNFVHDNNNPSDDHSHGTHVAGIIAMNYPDFSACEYRIIPVKTHDKNGTSNLFDVACGTYYATLVGASIINDSWGAYGTESEILGNAIGDADDNNVLIVTSSGNDGLELGQGNLQFPACFDYGNIITVGAFGIGPNGDVLSSTFSNFDSTLVDIIAPGELISSYVPGGGMETKSGTSQATPAVSAAAAYAFCNVGVNTIARGCVLDCATQNPVSLGLYANQGSVLNLDFECLDSWTSSTEPSIVNREAFQLFPNPASEKLNIISKSSIKNISLQLTDISGKILYSIKADQLFEDQVIELNVEQLPAGMYFINMDYGGERWVDKFLKF